MADSAIVCFMGIDGSGKSTLSKKLFEVLQEKEYDVRYTWWLEAENSILRTFISRLFSTKRAYLYSKMPESGNSKKNEASAVKALLTYIYPRIVLLDYLRFGLFQARLPRYFGDRKVLIFDRYYYDVVFALCREFGISDRERDEIIQLFQKFIPDPDILLLIDISPEQAHARKSEEIQSHDHAYRIWENQEGMYKELNRHVRTARWIRISNNDSIESAHQCVLNETLDYLLTRNSPSDRKASYRENLR